MLEKMEEEIFEKEDLTLEEQIEAMDIELKNKKSIFNFNLQSARDFLMKEEKSFFHVAIYTSLIFLNAVIAHLTHYAMPMRFYLPMQVNVIIAVIYRIQQGWHFKKEVKHMDFILKNQFEEINLMEEKKKSLLHNLESSKQSFMEVETEVVASNEVVSSKRQETIETLYQEKENLLRMTNERQKSFHILK